MGASIPIRPRAGSPTASIVPRPSSSRRRSPGRTRIGAASPRESLAIYELHVGAFTAEGTLDAIAPRLPQLADLGVTAIELMPVAQFPGDRNWGYDGVHPYAVQNSYGGPRALQRLVDAAHRRGLAVILDVVYNHLGPEGNYLGKFGPYFTDRYHTPWGNAINFDGPESDAVRAFFIHNARAWVRDFHVDGLRLDAVQTIYDFGVRHILADIHEAVQEEAARAGRTVHVIAESNQNDVRLVVHGRAAGRGWTACGRTTSTTASTPCYRAARPAITWTTVGPPIWPRRSATSSSTTAATAGIAAIATAAGWAKRSASRFVVCAQNHDQVGNNGKGDRLAASCRPRAAAGLRAALAVALHAVAVHGGRIRRRPAFSLLLLFRRAQAGRGGAAGTSQGRGVDVDCRAGGNPRSTERGNLRRGETELGVAAGDGPRWFATALWRPPGRAAPMAGAGRHRAAVGATGRFAEGARPDGEPALLAVTRGGGDGLLVLANLTVRVRHPSGRRLPTRSGTATSLLLLSTEAVRYGGQRRAGQPADGLLPYELMVFDRSGGRP